MSSRDRGQIRKRGEQKYLIRVYLGRVDGKRKYASKTIHGSRKKANKVLTKWLRDMDTDAFVEPQENMSVGQLMDEWLRSKTKIQPNTLRGYQNLVKNQIKPYIGFLKLSQVSEVRLEGLFETLASQYKAATLQQTRSCLSQAFKLAIRRRYIHRNPAVGIEMPVSRSSEEPVARSMTPQEVNKVLQAANGRYGAFWHVLLGTGMRPQEAAALRWDDLDLDQGKVTIRRVLRDWMSRGELRWANEGKTHQSLGTMNLPQSVVQVLRSHRVDQAREFMESGVRPEHAWIFATQSGEPPLDSNIRRAWKAVLKRAEVDETYRMYDCRHTHASTLLRAGVGIKVVQERLRHSSIAITADVYSHLTDEMDDTAAQVFDKVREQAEAIEETDTAARELSL